MLFLLFTLTFFCSCSPFPQELFKALQNVHTSTLLLNKTLPIAPWNSIGTRILNGTEVTPHSKPYLAYLLFVGSEYEWMCGGSLISEEYILTAGHCTTGATWAAVALGAHNASADEITQNIVIASNIKTHENYNEDTMTADIGLIKLSTAVNLTEAIQTIDLPTRAEAKKSLVGETVSIYGWGRTNGSNADGSDVLLGVNTTVLPDSHCLIYQVYNGNIQICTSGAQGQGACNGDSGGPLVSTQGKGVGIVSYGIQDCVTGYPSVFTKVGSYLDWIETNTNGTAANKSYAYFARSIYLNITFIIIIPFFTMLL